MKTHPNHPIENTYRVDGSVNTFGLTKREHFAALAMQAIYSKVDPELANPQGIAQLAVQAADDLINALNEKPNES